MIPSKVKVAGMEYEIEEIPDIEEQFDTLGKIFYTKGKIKIDKNLSKDRKEQVFVHELLHGIFWEAGFEEQDEDMVNRVSMILYQVLKDNKLQFGEKLNKCPNYDFQPAQGTSVTINNGSDIKRIASELNGYIEKNKNTSGITI
jgi:hypothetical protein